MGKSDKKDTQAVEQLGLWQINEIHISENYARNTTQSGRAFYTKLTNRQDLPNSFWELDWHEELEAREAAERQAISSGTSARDARGMNQGRLISQEIANNPNIRTVTSSGTRAQDKRGKGQAKGRE